MVRLNHLDTGRNLVAFAGDPDPKRASTPWFSQNTKVVDKVLGGLLIGLGIKVALG